MRRRLAILLTFFVSTTFLISANAAVSAPRVPAAPVIGTIVAGSQQITVPYTLGANNGSAIVNVEYSSDAGSTWSTTTSSPIIISSLTNGVTYTIKMRSTNGIGVGAVASKTAKPVGATNTITFASPAPMTYGDTDQKLVASSTANNVAFTTTTPLVCSIVSGSVRPLKAGTCSVTVASVATAYYAAATSVTKTFVISKSAQNITFPQPTDMLGSDADQVISASSNSGIVTFTSSTKSVCTIVNNAIHPVIAGPCTVVAASATNTQYLVANTVSRSITISKATQVITFPSPATMFTGDGNQTLNATSPAGIVTYASSTTSVCTAVSGAIHPVKAGTCVITASQAGTGKYFAASSVTRNISIYVTQSGPWTVRQTTFSDANSTSYPDLAGGWVYNGWYHSGLGFRIATTYVGSTTHMSYHVTDVSGNPAILKTVYFALGKVSGGSNAHVKVGTTVANGSVGIDGVTPVIISATTDLNGDVSFDIVNTDSSPSGSLYTQVSAYVTSFSADIIDITNINFSQPYPYAPTISSLSTSTGERGTTVTVTGTYLTNATFTIAGSAATVSAGATATSATVTVPSGASIGAGSLIASTSGGTATKSFEVLKITATVTLGSLSATYDGLTHAATATTNPSGKSVSFTYNSSATAPTNVGSYTVIGTITDSTFRGSATGTLTISKAVATVTLGALSATYDGLAHTATATTNPSGKTVAFTYNGATPAPSAIGSYAVVGTISDSSYSGTASGTLVISSPSPSASASASASSSPTSYACVLTSFQECGPLSALAVLNNGALRNVQNGAVTLSSGQDVTFAFTSSALDAAQHLQVHWYDLSAGLNTTVSSATVQDPWSTTLCYPDGAGSSQCQIQLDTNGAVTFTVHFTGNTNGKSFKYEILANGYSSGYVSGRSGKQYLLIQIQLTIMVLQIRGLPTVGSTLDWNIESQTST